MTKKDFFFNYILLFIHIANYYKFTIYIKINNKRKMEKAMNH